MADPDPYEEPALSLGEDDALDELEEAGALVEREPPVLAHAARVATSRKGISLRIM
ncbi:hypothetical protein KYC_21296 [Achromobacter arsenitoxydans SY8]|uniref:Uncharacterized protein n=1 Tax=Achromobacter arsenitoxydans SY8 TaxID=477184 RepID=H0FBV2_9BURK|nr:hypothetical protein KYC_21296 [Achromobacter arsenitoxydans SY8]